MVVVVVVVVGGWVGGLFHLVLGPNVTFLAQLPFPKHLDTQKKTWRHHKKVLPPSSVMIIVPFNTLTYIPSQWDWVECHRVIYQQFGWLGSEFLGVFAEESLTTKDGHECFKVNYEYIFKADGIAIAVQVMLASPSCPPAHLASLPRVGLRFVLPSGLSKMTWLGGDMRVCSQPASG